MMRYQEIADMTASTASSVLVTMSDCSRKWPKPRDDASPIYDSYRNTKLIGTSTQTACATPPSAYGRNCAARTALTADWSSSAWPEEACSETWAGRPATSTSTR